LPTIFGISELMIYQSIFIYIYFKNCYITFITSLTFIRICLRHVLKWYCLTKNWTVHFKGKKHIDKFSISMRLKTGILINKRQTYIEKIFPPSVNYINMKYTRYIPFLTQLYYIYLCVWVSVLWNIYFSKCGLRGMADIVVAFDLMTWPEPPDVWRKGDGDSTCSLRKYYNSYSNIFAYIHRHWNYVFWLLKSAICEYLTFISQLFIFTNGYVVNASHDRWVEYNVRGCL